MLDMLWFLHYFLGFSSFSVIRFESFFGYGLTFIEKLCLTGTY